MMQFYADTQYIEFSNGRAFRCFVEDLPLYLPLRKETEND